MGLTTEDMARLRVPLAALPGLADDEGTPIRVLVETVTGEREAVLYGGAMLYPDGFVRYLGQGEERHVSVDLADAATRDRVARWLAGRVGLEVGSTAPAFEVADFGEDVWYWTLGARDPLWRDGTDADLDPTDGRRLPDGSLYRDALALALVAVGAP